MNAMTASDTPSANLALWLLKRGNMAPDTPALIYWHERDTAERWTYGALRDEAHALAAWMTQQGIGRNDRVAFLDFNDARFAITMFATAHIGAIFVPLNFRLSTPEIVDTLNDCQASLLILGTTFVQIKADLQAASSCPRYLISSREGQDDYAAACRAARAITPPLAEVQWSDTAWLLYTSGSTGRPKGVMLTHGNIYWNTINTILAQGGMQTDRVLVSAPLFHAAPVSTFMESFLRGAQLHLERNFDADRLLGRIDQEGIAIVAGVPSMYTLMAASPCFDTLELRGLRSIIVGGAPVPQALIERYNRRGIGVIQRYGLTEAAPLVCALAPSSPPEKRMTAGHAPIFCDVRIRGTTQAEAPPGTIGEIEVRGPNVMAGYWNNEAETARAKHDGWLRTGDLGAIDAQGYISIHGRSKDMIISGGENVYAVEVESRLAENPCILEAAVIGLPDPKWGESVCAVVSLTAGSQSTAEALSAHLQGRLARYKQPRTFIFLPELPKNGAGKIDKLALKRRYASA